MTKASNALQLFACLHAREFTAQAMLRLRPELHGKPCAILQGEAPMQTVCSLNARARLLGVSAGMSPVELDTFSTIIRLPRSVSEEAAARSSLLECAGSFSPRVEDQSSGQSFLCVVDIAGTEKLLGSPQTLAKTLLRRVRTLGITASVTVCGNVHAAICHARGVFPRGGVTVLEPGTEEDALASLPLSVLGLSADCREIFIAWGIHTLGMLAALPETELIARMGQEGKRLRQLARGMYPHLLVPLEPAFRLEEFRELDSPVEELSSLLFVVGLMLEQLALRASARGYALSSVTVTLSLERAATDSREATHTREVRTALPTNDRPLWIKLIHLDLEAHPPDAPILALRLFAQPGVTSKVQLGLFSPQLPEPGRLDVTLARIRAIVGEDCVGSPVLKDTHAQEAFRMEPFRVPSTQALARASARLQPPTARSARRQLRPAEAVSMALREGRPASFFFRAVRYAVEHGYGPWLAGGDWWNPLLWRLEQWDLIARSEDGRQLCCCVVRDLHHAGWQMVAFYD